MDSIALRYKRLFELQYWYGKNFLEEHLKITDKKRLNILEIGPAEGGLLRYFYEKGHKCYGIEYSEGRVENSKYFSSDTDIDFLHGDITDSKSYPDKFNGKMDLVICRDVIEHIKKDEKITALTNMKNILNDSGKIFISFPPKFSPYAGHQQMVKIKFGRLPYVFLLPNFLYKIYLRIFGISKEGTNSYIRIKEDRLSITQFEKLVNDVGLKILRSDFYFIRPNYEKRLKIKRRKQPFKKFFLREILTFGAKYILTK